MRVGRAAIDEQGMRLLEQFNPDVQFDWPRLLKDTPPDPARQRERDPRERDRRDRRDSRPPQRARPLETTGAAVPPSQAPMVHDRIAEAAEERAEAHADLVLSQHAHDTAEPLEELPPLDPSEPPAPEAPEPLTRFEAVEPADESEESLAVAHREPLAADHAEYVEFAEASHLFPKHHVERAEPAEPRTADEPANSAAAARLGADGLLRLRQRYTQIVARLAEKPMEEESRVELNARVERLNPDAWLTADEVAAALEQYESVFESLRAVIGHYPPRRRRR